MLITRLLDEWGCEVDASAAHGEVAIVVPVRRCDGPAASTGGWEEQLDQQVAVAHDALPASVIDRARGTIRALADDTTTTMMHGDSISASLASSKPGSITSETKD